MNETVYANYELWKSWNPDNFLKTSPQEEAYFTGEMTGIELKGRKVLELGFGNGSFLGYVQALGADIYGTELLEPALRSAQTSGIKLLPIDLSESSNTYGEAFDVIAAFDVLEHLTIDQVDSTLEHVAKMLRPGGIFIARFPNGQSPLGRVWQHGDHTHRSTLSALILRQLIIGKQLKVVRAGDQYREYYGSTIKKSMEFIRFRLQDITVWIIHKIFKFGEPMGLNTVVVITRL